MQGTVSKYRVALKRKQRKWLLAIVKRRTASHWLVVRSKVILLASELASIQAICARSPWTGRWSADGAGGSFRAACMR